MVHELIIHKLLAYGDQAVRIGSHQLWCNVDYLKVAVWTRWMKSAAITWSILTR